MSSGHHGESQNQFAAITTNITRGRDVLAALAAAWSSSLDLNAASEENPLLHTPSDPRPESDNTTRASQ